MPHTQNSKTSVFCFGQDIVKYILSDAMFDTTK